MTLIGGGAFLRLVAGAGCGICRRADRARRGPGAGGGAQPPPAVPGWGRDSLAQLGADADLPGTGGAPREGGGGTLHSGLTSADGVVSWRDCGGRPPSHVANPFEAEHPPPAYAGVEIGRAHV